MKATEYEKRVSQLVSWGIREPLAKMLGALHPAGKEFSTKDLMALTGYGRSWINITTKELMSMGYVSSRTLPPTTSGQPQKAYTRTISIEGIKRRHKLDQAYKKAKFDDPGTSKLSDEDWSAAGLKPAEIRLLKFMLQTPPNTCVRSVEITAKLGITQATISESMRALKALGWVVSGQNGYCRVKTLQEIKAEVACGAEA